MLTSIKDFLNIFILGFLILVFDHIEKNSFFGFFYPWIGIILVSFVIYFTITMPYFLQKPKGFIVLLIGILFIFFQYFTSSAETFRTSSIFISFIVIITIIVKNTNPEKLKFFLKIILFCCLSNLLYAIYQILFTEVKLSASYRLSGFDQDPVLFGYNMLLGFWLVNISSITGKNLDKSNSKIDNLFSLLFIIAIFLSQSLGAISGLITGLIAVLIYKKKIKKSSIYKFLLISIFIFLIIFIFPSFFWESFGLKRLDGKLTAYFTGTRGDERFSLWYSKLVVYANQLTILKFLFGEGQGAGTDLTQRGVHSDHLKLLFDHGIIGLLIYYSKIFSCLKLVKEFNEYIIGFIFSVLVSGIFYVNFGSITNSFTCILTIIVLSNYNKHMIKNN